jgi:hypothetical protein
MMIDRQFLLELCFNEACYREQRELVRQHEELLATTQFRAGPEADVHLCIGLESLAVFDVVFFLGASLLAFTKAAWSMIV